MAIKTKHMSWQVSRYKEAPCNYSSNQGVVLFVSLIILLTLTIIGLSAMNNSFIELKTASNTQEKDVACQASQAGLDAVMCLADQTRSGTTSNNPLDKTYSIVTATKEEQSKKFNWDWDETYDTENILPFVNDSGGTFTANACSIDSGILDIGTIGNSSSNTSQDLNVAVRRIPNSASLRAIKGNSYEKLECHNYIIDSRYDYPTSGAKGSVWAGVCRQVGK